MSKEKSVFEKYVKQLADYLWDAFAEDKLEDEDEEEFDEDNDIGIIALDRYGRRTSWMSENAYIVYLPTTEVVETFKNYWQEEASYVDKPTTYIRAYSDDDCGDDWVFLPTTMERDYHTNKIREIDKLLGILWDKSDKGDR